MPKIGDRVGAILCTNDEEGVLELLGFGTYEGEEFPETAVGFMAELVIEAGHKNPKIKLDNGDVVWGCECWWGSEEKIRRSLEGWNVKEVRIADARKAILEEEKDNA